MQALSDEAIDTILHYAVSVPSPQSAIILELYGGKALEEPEGGTAFPHRENLFDLVIISHWPRPEEDDTNISWTRKFWNDMQPFTSQRVYVNVLGVEGEQRVKDAYGENYERLRTLKKKYDPENIFHLNQNINPTS